ncbi:NAD(P)H-dependent oxidoreductase [Helicobacter kayseriensis]|uniref:NAD(P)H-dependent oxidoreductase n=1 Tax=Helicobacter kayseriensis TaxID=2905877 RepID=UPI001E31324E|nr:NAD(P)H-dependent oxidoreductase [Helicobacter kayseriensis]MCE3047551.1 NAD(P)H-dependent oxidoreductase [Helicobacter kayseriensis]MCE3048873.1 NAD(P)H-dependent oxidoreductase [Helicobacter kayseriensis]
MKHVLLLNGAKVFGSSGGKLNTALHQLANEILTQLGYEVEQTCIDQGYTIQEEVEKILRADVLLYQMPAWWMGEPWIVKKYIDEVFLGLYGKLFSGDGRSREDESKKYGTGGGSHGKKYLFSTTWNAPLEAFVEKNQFFEGRGVDGALFSLHKTHQFIGMQALESFACYDVVKNPKIEQYQADYAFHLKKIFSSNQ